MDEFERRKKYMLCTQAILASVYLDRRISVELKEWEIELAKLCLCDIWERIRKDHSEDQKNISNQSQSYDEDSFDLEQYFILKGYSVIPLNLNQIQSAMKFSHLLQIMS